MQIAKGYLFELEEWYAQCVRSYYSLLHTQIAEPFVFYIDAEMRLYRAFKF